MIDRRLEPASRNPIGLLNVGGCFDALMNWISHAEAEGFIRQKHVALLNVSTDAAGLLELLLRYEPPAPVPKWAGHEDR